MVDQPPSAAASMPPATRQRLAVEILSKTEPVSHIADKHEVSRKFLYQQKEKATEALERAFALPNRESDVLFYLPVTQAWLHQLIVGLILICHSSYRGVVELLRDVFDWPISASTVTNRVQSVAERAETINESEDLSGIRVGLHDEIFQSGQPVLAGVCAFSTYCYLLEVAEQRDGDTWGWHLLEASERGLAPEFTIADGGTGLRAGQELAWPGIPCHGDAFHAIKEGKDLARYLTRKAQKATTHREKLEQQMEAAKLRGKGNKLSKPLTLARQEEQAALNLATDVKILLDWLSHDILQLAGPEYSVRQELLAFIVAELKLRECQCPHRIGPLRRALHNQREQLLAFARLLDDKLAEIAERFAVSLVGVREVCLLQRKPDSSTTYWQRWNQLHHQLKGRFLPVLEAVTEAMAQTPRASSMVENLNSRLRNYFFLRRQLGAPYLELLRFFLNHRTFIRSERPERVGKSPAELMTGQPHPHWLELLGFERFRRKSA
ncbi:MAG: hypothetical protein AB4050_17455 [Synechococcus sp.]